MTARLLILDLCTPEGSRTGSFFSRTSNLFVYEWFQSSVHEQHAWGACMQAQRAGLAGDDSSSLFPGVWSWKSPAYTNMCSEVIDALDPEDAQRIDLAENGGFFEAGSAFHLYNSRMGNRAEFPGHYRENCMEQFCYILSVVR